MKLKSLILTFLKYLFLGLLLVVLFQGNLNASVLTFPVNVSQGKISQETTPRNLAQTLTEEGHSLLNSGNAEAALQRWKQATEIYKALNYEEGIKGSLINESIALRSLGLYRQACLRLKAALGFSENSPLCASSSPEMVAFPTPSLTRINAIGLRNLGETLRLIGNLKESNLALAESWEIVQEMNFSSEASLTLLTWGNTKRDYYKFLRNLYQRSQNAFNGADAVQEAQLALDYYNQVSSSVTEPLTLLQAKVNRLSLLVELKEWSDVISEISILKTYLETATKPLEASLNQLQNDLKSFHLPLTKDATYVQIKLAKSLSQLQKYDSAIAQGLEAVRQARELGDKRTESYALGTLGFIYEQQQQFSLATTATQDALTLSYSLFPNDISYLWEWQLGRIYTAGNSPEKAMQAYDLAIKNLDAVRKDLLGIDANVQFSFQENIEPLYRQYLALLLQPQAPPQQLNKAIEVIKALQIAELENYLQCHLTSSESLPEIEKQPAAIIYTILIHDSVQIITKFPQLGDISLHSPPVSRQEFESQIFNLKSRLSEPINDIETFILPEAQQLYTWLIQPIASQLPANGTLLFVSEQSLQNLPMAILHDGQHYLIEKYSIATSLNAQLPSPQRLQTNQLKVLLAGVSKKGQSFPPYLSPLPYVDDELKKINSLFSSQVLLNSDFTRNAFEKQVQTAKFSIVHIATHGKFSSDPKKTVIYAWDDTMNVQELDHILRARTEKNPTPIQLLVLSACETAKGDKQATLGIAGMALNANTSSILASLWQVADEPTAQFMSLFYEILKQPNMSKAEALRQVQRRFLEQGYHPYYWSAFIIAGNWL